MMSAKFLGDWLRGSILDSVGGQTLGFPKPVAVRRMTNQSYCTLLWAWHDAWRSDISGGQFVNNYLLHYKTALETDR